MWKCIVTDRTYEAWKKDCSATLRVIFREFSKTVGRMVLSVSYLSLHQISVQGFSR